MLKMQVTTGDIIQIGYEMGILERLCCLQARMGRGSLLGLGSVFIYVLQSSPTFLCCILILCTYRVFSKFQPFIKKMNGNYNGTDG